MSIPTPVLITGASQGIGRALALELAQRRIPLALGARTLPKLEALKGEIRGFFGNEALVHPLDVADSKSCQAFIEAARGHFGSIGTLVNNAGVGIYGPVHETAPEDFEATIKTNLFGPFSMIKAALPAFFEQKRGMIVNISSVSGRVSVPFMGVYSASKFALNALTEAMREELRRKGVHTLLVMPGVIKTEFGENALGSHKALGKKSVGSLGVSPQKLAKKIVLAMEKGRLELVYPSWYRPLAFLKNTFPTWSERLTYRFLARLLHP
jgi:short-subunit dehydrogenase